MLVLFIIGEVSALVLADQAHTIRQALVRQSVTGASRKHPNRRHCPCSERAFCRKVDLVGTASIPAKQGRQELNQKGHSHEKRMLN
jgi:hypothetical protein